MRPHYTASRYKYHQGKDSVGEILNPTNGYRGAQLAKGRKLQDHAKQNRAALREMQRVNRLKRQPLTVPKAFKMPEFEGVQSRVYEKSPTQPDSPIFTFMKKGEGTARRKQAKGKSSRPRTAWKPGEIPPSSFEKENRSQHKKDSKPQVPRAADTKPKPRRASTDFIGKNRQRAGRPSSAPLPKTGQAPYTPKGIGHALGEVPAYLLSRQQRWQAQEEAVRAAAPDPDAPKGQTRVPEDDRVATLRVLEQSREAELRKLASLPLQVVTPTAAQRKQRIETRLKEIDDAVAIFSKSKVYTVA